MLTAAVTLGGAALTMMPAGAASNSSGKVNTAAILRVGVPIEENGGVFFDPAGPKANVQSPSNRLFQDLIYDVMIHNTPDGKGSPGLATKWSAPDAQTVELDLRTGVKFADGTPFNAAAVKGAWDRLISSGRPNLTPNVKAIQSVEQVDDNTIRLHLNQPVAQALIDDDLRNSNDLGVPSPASIAAGTVESKPVGAGPYQLDNYTTGKLTLKKNPNYYDRSQQKLAGLEFDQVPFGGPSVSALQSGTEDLVWQIPPDSVKTIQGQNGLNVFSAPSQTVFTVNLCPTKGVFANKEARQAIQYALDRNAINEAALAGTGQPATTPLTPASPNYNKTLAKMYSYNPKKAKALLKQAGVAPGTTVKALVPAISPYTAVADVVQSQLKDVGLNVDVTQSTDVGGDLIRQSPDMAFVSLSPTLFPLAFSGQTGALNMCGWKNDQVAAALNAARDPSQTPAQQQQAWDTMQKTVLDESPVVVADTQGVLAAMNDKVKGLDVINSPYGPQLFGVYMTK
jgi:ABC-type transport system substrate-binding protein